MATLPSRGRLDQAPLRDHPKRCLARFDAPSRPRRRDAASRAGAPLCVWLLALLLMACAPDDVLGDVSIEPDKISPNQDGQADVARMAYTIGRPAELTVSLQSAGGETYILRDAVRREPADAPYEALFSGIIDDRMLPDGEYTVTFAAAPLDGGPTARRSVGLTIEDADATPPMLHGFSVQPRTFTPNQDGIGDRVAISYRLDERADVRIYLEDDRGQFITDILEEVESAIEPGDPGPHVYDYDAGVDDDAPPPPDGAYHVVGEARDSIGNVHQVRVPLQIVDGGQPRAALIGDVRWSARRVTLGETLWFTATVSNVGNTPIRTRGPWPGFVYDNTDSFNQPAPAAFILVAHGGDGRAGAALAAPGAEDVVIRLVDTSDAAADILGRSIADDIVPLDDPTIEATGRSPRPAGTSLSGPEAPPIPPDADRASPAAVCGRIVGADGGAATDVELTVFESDGDNGASVDVTAEGEFCAEVPSVPPEYQRNFARSPGSVRVGVEYDAQRTDLDHPYRWQLGPTAALDVCQSEGVRYLCLPPGETTNLTGGIRFVEPPFGRSFNIWLTLMHEDVRRMHGPYQVQRVAVDFETPSSQ